MSSVGLDNATELRRFLAILDWGEEIDLTPEEIGRIQQLDDYLQDVEVKRRGYVFVEELCNHYHCEDCDNSWSDAWCCACDDECSECRADLSPEVSDIISVTIIKLKTERCDVCGEPHEF